MASAYAIFATLPLCSCFYFGAWSRADHYAADLQIGEKIQKRSRMLGRRFARILGWPFSGDVLEKCPNRFFRIFQKMTQKLAKRFARILGWPFLGDVLENVQIDSARWSSIVCRRRMAANLGKSFWGILRWPFLGDVLNNLVSKLYRYVVNVIVVSIVYYKSCIL